jgi:hypothetical protein
MTEPRNVAQSRPNLYLLTYDCKLDAASVISNFLHAVFSLPNVAYPSRIEVNVAGPYFTIAAIGCSMLDQVNEPEQLPWIFDIRNTLQGIPADITHSLGFLRPIIWFTEHCLADITTASGTFRQAFLLGRPLENLTLLLNPSDTPRIGFCFTLPSAIFDNTHLDCRRLKRVLALWKKKEFGETIPHGVPIPELKLKWRVQSDHNYSLLIVVQGLANLKQTDS